jgi:RND family efflux transporter MFP subunit
VSFTVTAFGDQVFQGNVKYISPNLREASRDLIVEAVVPNADLKLKPGMFAVARIGLGDTSRTVVPRSAVVQDDTGARVFVVAGPTIQERVVQLGGSVGDVVAVLEGVKTGENVVVQPGPDVHDGVRVE